MKGVIVRLGLILSFLGCVVVIVATLPSFNAQVLFLLVLLVAGVWGILLKPNFTINAVHPTEPTYHEGYAMPCIEKPRMSEKEFITMFGGKFDKS